MEILAGKLDWLKERKDFFSNPQARAAIRLLENQYMPHGEDLYPWILRELKRGNIQLPGQFQDNPQGEPGPWMKLVQMEMQVEQELARREHEINTNPDLGDTDPWHVGSDDIDWNNLQQAPNQALNNYFQKMNKPDDEGHTPWYHIFNYMGGMRLKVPNPKRPEPNPNLPGGGHEQYRYPDTSLHPNDLKQWERTLTDRAKRRQGVDPMQFSAPDFLDRMNKEWIPEWEDRQRADLGRVIHRFPDKWTVRAIQNAEECEREGEEMGHCMGSYGPQLERGSTHLFSLRDPRNKPHASWEIKPGTPNLNTLPASLFTEYGLEPGVDTHRVQYHLHELNHGLIPDTPVSTRQQKALAMAQALYRGGYTGSPEQPWHGGRLVQVQGKENSSPNEEYKDRIRNWFGTFPQEALPTNLHETAYEPTNPQVAPYCPECGENTGPPNQFGECVNCGVPLNGAEGGRLARTEEHYPAPAHKNRITGEICHCPWGADRELWSWNEHIASRDGSDLAFEDPSWDHLDTNPPYERSEGFQEVVDMFAPTGLACRFTEDPDVVNIDYVNVPDDKRGQGTGTRFMQAAQKYADDNGKQLVISEVDNTGFFSKFPFLQQEETGGRPVFHSKLASPFDEQMFNEKRPYGEYRNEPSWSRIHPDLQCPNCGDALTFGGLNRSSLHCQTCGSEAPVPQDMPMDQRLDMIDYTDPDAYTETHLPGYTPKWGGKVIPHENLHIPCPTCQTIMTNGHCPQCEWSAVDANLDHDPLSNPPDPTHDLHRGIQAAVIPSHRWSSRWMVAVEDV